MSGSELVGLADRLQECLSAWSYDMKDAAFAQLNQFPDELRELAGRRADGYVMAPREIVEAVLKRDGGTACGCNNVSRQADREYEMGKCPHQRLAAAMIATAPTADPAAGIGET